MNETDLQLWHPKRVDALPIALILLLPLLVAAPLLLGWLNADPMVYYGQLGLDTKLGWAPGIPYNDPNNAYTTQALGIRAALDWLSGSVPWWNPYSGVGLPLAAEFQPAAFFPLTLLILLPNGMVWQHLALQVLAGLGTYAFLRQIGLARLASTTGGLLFAFNGTLAWFAHGPAGPVAFLPWLLYGVERALAKAEAGQACGWRLFALALAMSLLAGFPETAYIDGLLVLAWAMLRLIQSQPAARLRYVGKVFVGGLVGLGLSAPQLLAFFEYLPLAFLGGHDGATEFGTLGALQIVPSFVAPYIYGPLPKHCVLPWKEVAYVWIGLGGYVDLALLAMASYGIAVRRGPVTWLMLGWTVLALARAFGMAPISEVMDLVPGIRVSAFSRYAQPTWEFALITLAAFAVDDLSTRPDRLRRRVVMVIAALAAMLLAWSVVYLNGLLPKDADMYRWRWAAISLVLAGASAAWVMNVAASRKGIRRGLGVAVVLVMDGIVMYAFPTSFNSRGGKVDQAAIHFLQATQGTYRSYSLGPMQANYSAAFGIANINHNQLPVDRRWVEWVRNNLDPNGDPIAFDGAPRQGRTEQLAALERDIGKYEWLGVKYLIAPAGETLFMRSVAMPAADSEGVAVDLGAGDRLAGKLPEGVPAQPPTVTAVGVQVGNYGGRADGLLTVSLCANGRCVGGRAELARSIDNAIFVVPLDETLPVHPGDTVTYAFEHRGGTHKLALWAYPAVEQNQDQSLSGQRAPMAKAGLRLELFGPKSQFAAKLRTVYNDALMQVLELPAPKPYFEILGDGCRVADSGSRTQVRVDCAGPGRLVRRELFFPGWRATVDGQAAVIGEFDGLFQVVDLPAGEHRLEFSYSPPYVEWAWLAFVGSLLFWLLPTFRWAIRSRGVHG